MNEKFSSHSAQSVMLLAENRGDREELDLDTFKTATQFEVGRLLLYKAVSGVTQSLFISVKNDCEDFLKAEKHYTIL